MLDTIWCYNEPNSDGTNNYVEISEQDILKTYKDSWSREMIESGFGSRISDWLCIQDFIILHWAYKK